MRTKILCLSPLVPIVCLLMAAPAAHGQATRTWVSGVGDDVNPCSRTAPCKTWAGAISKTADGGEIDALDPGGFGTLNITKSITINGRGTHASVLASGTSGIIVNADPTDVVILRDLEIQGTRRGTSPGTNGIRYLKAKSLHIYDTSIRGFNDSGVKVESTAADTSPLTDPLRLFMKNVEMADCSRGIALAPVTSREVRASVRNSEIHHFDTQGIYVGGAGVRGTFSDMDVAGGTPSNGTGVFAEASARINLRSSVIEGSHIGIRSFSSAIVRVSDSTITDNTTGLVPNGGQILSRTNNTVQDNGVDGVFSGTYGPS